MLLQVAFVPFVVFAGCFCCHAVMPKMLLFSCQFVEKLIPFSDKRFAHLLPDFCL